MEEEGKVADQETGMSEKEPDQQFSEEQNYWETVKGVQLFMGWQQLPEFESSASFQDNNPVLGPSQPANISETSIRWLALPENGKAEPYFDRRLPYTYFWYQWTVQGPVYQDSTYFEMVWCVFRKERLFLVESLLLAQWSSKTLLVILSIELLDSPYLLDHQLPSLLHRKNLEDGRGQPGTHPLFATRQLALVAV